MHKLLVLGVGNILMGDDGVGVHVVNELLKTGLPEGVDVVDVGTLGLSALPVFDDAEAFVIVDAIDAGLPAGEMVEISMDPLKIGVDWVPGQRITPGSLHEISVFHALNLSCFLGKRPKHVSLIGIQALSVEPSTELSPELRRRIGEYAEAVRNVAVKILRELEG